MLVLSKSQIFLPRLGADQPSHSKSSGLQVIVTCSPHNFDLAKSLGADSVFDYRSPTCVADVRAASDNNIRHIFDCISTPATAQVSAGCFGANGGQYSALHPIRDFPRSDVNAVFTSAYTIFGEKFRYGPNEISAKPEDYEFGVKFWALAQELLASGKIKPHPHRVWPGGLEGIPEGLKSLEEEKVSGYKIVYRIAD